MSVSQVQKINQVQKITLTRMFVSTWWSQNSLTDQQLYSRRKPDSNIEAYYNSSSSGWSCAVIELDGKQTATVAQLWWSLDEQTALFGTKVHFLAVVELPIVCTRHVHRPAWEACVVCVDRPQCNVHCVYHWGLYSNRCQVDITQHNDVYSMTLCFEYRIVLSIDRLLFERTIYQNCLRSENCNLQED